VDIQLSAVVLCQDNERTIGTVLDSLVPFCDEVVVVDGGSEDATAAVARSREKVRLFEREFDSFPTQRNYACDRARGRWILVLDSDELIAPNGLRKLRWLTHVPGFHWYSLPRYWIVERNRRFYYLSDRPYYRDRQLRLFRNEPGFRYDEVRTPVHEEFREKRGWGRPLRGPHIFHYALLLHDRAARERKYRRYMAIDPDLEQIHRQQLWEDHEIPLEPVPVPLPGMLHES